MNLIELQKQYDILNNNHNSKFSKGVVSEKEYQVSCKKMADVYAQMQALTVLPSQKKINPITYTGFRIVNK